MNPVVHFEMPAEDSKRMSEFYTKAFGWQVKQMGPEFGNYILVQTGETDDKGMMKKPGMIGGGFHPKMKGAEHPSVVIQVDDIRASMKKVADGGGKILACGTCLKLRNSNGSELCPLSTMKDLYEIVRDSDKVVTF